MSTTRRVFLRNAALGALALPVLKRAACAASADRPALESRSCAAPLQFDRVFYDARRPQALAFAEAAARAGLSTRALSGDFGDACYEQLRARWLSAGTPVAGMTDFRVLFLLQMMSAAAGLGPVMRIHHCARGAAMTHEAFGRRMCHAAAVAHLSQAGTQWGAAAARVVLNLTTDDQVPKHGAADMSAANQRALDSRTLVTWVIA